MVNYESWVCHGEEKKKGASDPAAGSVLCMLLEHRRSRATPYKPVRDNIVCTVNTANGNCFEGRLTDRAGLDLPSMFHGFITMQALPSIFLIGVCGCERGGWVRV